MAEIIKRRSQMDKNTVKGSRVIYIWRETDTYMTKVTLQTEKKMQQIKIAVTALKNMENSGPYLVTKISCKPVKHLAVKWPQKN